MKVRKHRRLTLKGRVIIQALLEEKNAKAFIAKTLNRACSTISREVNKLVSNPDDKYDADLTYW